MSASATRVEKSVVQAGVGMVLEESRARACLVVVKLADGGPAHASNKIQVGDVLQHVDGEDVRGKTLEDVVPRIVGQEGSTIKLVFERGLHRALITCFLVRGDHRKGIARPWSNSPKVSTHVAPPKRSHAPSSKVPDYQLGTAGSKALQEGAAPAARASRQNEALFPSLEYFGGTTNVPAAVATRSRVPSEALMRSANRRSSGSQSRIEAPRHSTPMPQELPSGHTFLERRARLIWEQCRSSNAESDDSSSCDDAPSKSRGLRGAGCSRSSMSTSRTRHPARLRCADMDGGEQTSNLLANARRIWAQCKSVENDEPTEGADEI